MAESVEWASISSVTGLGRGSSCGVAVMWAASCCWPLGAGCTGPLSTLETAGPAASSLAALWWAMFFGSTALFLLVMALFALVVGRPAAGARVSVRGWIVWGGLVLPAVVLPPLVAFALVQGDRLLPHAAPVPRIEAEAWQWGWTFGYPDHGGGATDDVLHLPASVPVDIHITSRDVIHSFWVPRLAGKLDAIPGHRNVLRLEADAPGRMGGRCAEFCGLDHSGMAFEVVVHPPEAYAAALAEATGR
jgi:cytochrome c oxidase subunit II